MERELECIIVLLTLLIVWSINDVDLMTNEHLEADWSCCIALQCWPMDF